MSLVYFTDRDLGKQFPEILREAGLTVERHMDHFNAQTPDPEWLAEVGKNGWIALTHDGKIRYKPNEQKAVIDNGVALLVIMGKAKHADLANSFVAALPRIERFLIQHKPPFIAKVYRPTPADLKRSSKAIGRIELAYPKELN